MAYSILLHFTLLCFADTDVGVSQSGRKREWGEKEEKEERKKRAKGRKEEMKKRKEERKKRAIL